MILIELIYYHYLEGCFICLFLNCSHYFIFFVFIFLMISENCMENKE